MESKDFPSFSDFASSLMLEAEVACNPVTYIYALHSLESHSDKGNPRDIKRNEASVFSTGTAVHCIKQTWDLTVSYAKTSIHSTSVQTL